jgi:RNA polymerase sigma-70 factor (ECF subfamily)
MPPFSPRTSITEFLSYYNELLGVWTRKLRNRQDAEDVTHDAVLRILEADSVPILQPRAYLHQTARNIATDAYRRKGVHEAAQLAFMDRTDAHDEDPAAILSAAEVTHVIERALSELPLKCRQVFIWQRLDGLTQAEIALRLNVSKNTVEKYMIRTMRHLRSSLAAVDAL